MRALIWLGAAMCASAAPQSRPDGPFTAAQAAAGRSAYQASCAGCHLDNLLGRNEAPALTGGNFMNAWGSRSSRELNSYIASAMPPGNIGGLGRAPIWKLRRSFCRLTVLIPVRSL